MGSRPGADIYRPLSVLIIDSDLFVRKTLSRMLSEAQGITVRAAMQSCSEAFDILRREPIDVVLMGIGIPAADVLSGMTGMLQEFPGVDVLVLGSSADDETIRMTMGLGAGGFLLKNADSEEITQSIRCIAAGVKVLSGEIIQDLFPSGESLSVQASLSSGEKDVLSLVARGRTNPEIAAELLIAESTVKSRLSRLSSKLGTSSRVSTAVRAQQLRLV
ncbi:response regulator [Arachnia rubra]|jgi:two component luxR family transcriptional regulator|uniref:Response regulator transcription factor n=1 Tax=Arachnia rubra TaxID=1547448 RepID=A0ABX7Y2A0_9ACTN|nr:response regulator transcription factor [Arachnia rubra]MBB1570151.1 response regulator transcription factor [Propionibacterium sp.]MDO4644616.1 response regulator transcription factor [Propionibacteriaceae bacterium]QUC07101.1 response regulator transcription factor [Arachnia rubra]BCR81350.1 DNA-binding response regulator [Arachnia rubra]